MTAIHRMSVDVHTPDGVADAGVRHRTEIYEGVQHGFTQADTTAYDTEATERHHREMLALFDRNLPR